MQDSDTIALMEKQHLQRLEQRINDMLIDKSLDYRQIVKELDNECQC